MQPKLAIGTAVGSVGLAGATFEVLRLANSLPKGAFATGGLVLGGAVAGGLVTYFLLRKMTSKELPLTSVMIVMDTIEASIGRLKVKSSEKKKLQEMVSTRREEYKTNVMGKSSGRDTLRTFAVEFSVEVLELIKHYKTNVSFTTKLLRANNDELVFNMVVLLEYTNLLSPIKIPTSYLNEGQNANLRIVRKDLEYWLKNLNKVVNTEEQEKVGEYLTKEVELLDTFKSDNRTLWQKLTGQDTQTIASQYKSLVDTKVKDPSYFVNIFNYERLITKLDTHNFDEFRKELLFLQRSMNMAVNELEENQQQRLQEWQTKIPQMIIALDSVNEQTRKSEVRALLKAGGESHISLRNVVSLLPDKLRQNIVWEYMLVHERNYDSPEYRSLIEILRLIVTYSQADRAKKEEIKKLIKSKFRLKEDEIDKLLMASDNVFLALPDVPPVGKEQEYFWANLQHVFDRIFHNFAVRILYSVFHALLGSAWKLLKLIMKLLMSLFKGYVHWALFLYVAYVIFRDMAAYSRLAATGVNLYASLTMGSEEAEEFYEIYNVSSILFMGNKTTKDRKGFPPSNHNATARSKFLNSFLRTIGIETGTHDFWDTWNAVAEDYRRARMPDELGTGQKKRKWEDYQAVLDTSTQANAIANQRDDLQRSILSFVFSGLRTASWLSLYMLHPSFSTSNRLLAATTLAGSAAVQTALPDPDATAVVGYEYKDTKDLGMIDFVLEKWHAMGDGMKSVLDTFVDEEEFEKEKDGKMSYKPQCTDNERFWGGCAKKFPNPMFGWF